MSAEPQTTPPLPPGPARSELAALLARVARGERVVVVAADGEPPAALVPLAELERLQEAAEDLEDIRAALASERHHAESGASPEPAEEVFKDLGL
ncbi:MAG: type II toxin-antitoxin system Phd/YefM family antitoxin [Armatimonadetes bacterium]|nr:type II toxin-antitoxin system Phd/YefM family antitoxin [Armatimonadota bacterium]